MREIYWKIFYLQFQRSHMLYDRQGDQHYDMISALHKSIRASDDNAALYWCTRMMIGGEDPRYICRRLVRAASEDIGIVILGHFVKQRKPLNVFVLGNYHNFLGLADPNAVSVALSALDAVQLVGMPESDCIIAQAAVYLARAPKSREVSYYCKSLEMAQNIYCFSFNYSLGWNRFTKRWENANTISKIVRVHSQQCHCIYVTRRQS